MRRRLINQLRAAGVLPPVALHEKLAWEAARTPVQAVPKGFCRHCGLKVGKGIYFHEKACGARHE